MLKKLLVTILFLSTPLWADTVTIPTTYQNGSTVTASNLNGNFTAITVQVNGGLDNNNANTVGGYRFFETKSSLPTNGSQGRVVFLTTNNTLNFDNGSSWQTTVTPTGTPSTGYIPYYNSGWNLLAPGSQYYSLVSNGASSLPSYQQINLANGVTSTLSIANGGTGQTTAQAAIDALLPSQTGNSGKFLTTNGTASSWGVPTGNSNVLFQYVGAVEQQGSAIGEIISAVYKPVAQSGKYRFLMAIGNATTQIFSSKFIKISGISTVTIWTRIWQNTSGAATLAMNIGGATGSVTGTSSQQTPEWKSFTINVSGLSNGTSYDVTATLTTGTNIDSYCSDIIGFGS